MNQVLLVASGILLLLLSWNPLAAAESDKPFPVRDKYVSLTELFSLAKDGDDEAQVTLGTAYAVGGTVPGDMEKATYWWTEAAKKGNTKAQIALGTRYGVGLGVEQDIQKALYWLKEADRNGDPAAASHLGYVYEHGAASPRIMAKQRSGIAGQQAWGTGLLSGLSANFSRMDWALIATLPKQKNGTPQQPPRVSVERSVT